MRTDFVSPFQEMEQAVIANEILRRCVHCGFCNATCPTYQLLGDELDGPRGRIYLIKQVLEGGQVTAALQSHLDRCLICKACETTCPSGVEYSKLLEIGQYVIDKDRKRSAWQNLQRAVLNKILPNAARLHWLFSIARLFRILLPAQWETGLTLKKASLPAPTAEHKRRMLLLKGCVQSQVAPDINRAAMHLMDRLEISLVEDTRSNGCCGAISHHLTKPADAARAMRENIDAWWPEIENGLEAIVITASGCSPHVKEYGRLLRGDTSYREKAQRVSQLAKDISELVSIDEIQKFKKLVKPIKLAFHSPCSLQHGQRIVGVVERILQGLGYLLTPVNNAHLCCGAAGTYTLLQSKISDQLLINKVVALEKGHPQVIATANIGCLLHLQRDSSVPVKHWIELIVENNLP